MKDEIVNGRRVEGIYHTKKTMEYLEEDTKKDGVLIIIGYGFGDKHINQQIKVAYDNGTKIFVIGKDDKPERMHEYTGEDVYYDAGGVDGFDYEKLKVELDKVLVAD